MSSPDDMKKLVKNKQLISNYHKCNVTPKKSDIYYKIKSAHDDIVTDVDVDVHECSGILPNGTIYEKYFKEGVQKGDWAYYSKNGETISAELYRKNIPVYNHAYYPNGKIACMMVYNHTNSVCTMTLFTPRGFKVTTVCNIIPLKKSNMIFKIVRTWHDNGHLHTELPMHIVHTYSNNSDDHSGGDTTSCGVHREWYHNGQLKKESFVTSCATNKLFTRTWNDAGACTCEWSWMGNTYKEYNNSEESGYTYTLNGKKITEILL
jgi:antitoxin component YwqK of YwqJK toxin-antitoxin module